MRHHRIEFPRHLQWGRSIAGVRHAAAAVWHSEIGFALIAGASGWIALMILLALLVLGLG
jgi:hypothetical protein